MESIELGTVGLEVEEGGLTAGTGLIAGIGGLGAGTEGLAAGIGGLGAGTGGLTAGIGPTAEAGDLIAGKGRLKALRKL